MIDLRSTIMPNLHFSRNISVKQLQKLMINRIENHVNVFQAFPEAKGWAVLREPMIVRWKGLYLCEESKESLFKSCLNFKTIV